MREMTIRGRRWPDARRLRIMAILFPACILLCIVSPAAAPSGLPPGAQQTTAGGGETWQQDDPELPLLEAIRGENPERLFELLRQEARPLAPGRRWALEALAHYRLADFDATRALLAKMDIGAAESLLLRALLGAAEGRFRQAEELVSAALARRSELGLLGFEAGLLHSYLLQHLGKPRQAAGVIEQLLAEAPFGKPGLRSIQKSLEISPEDPYRIKAVAADHTIPLLADGSLPPRTVLELRPGEPGRLVLFDTGSSLTMLKSDIEHDMETGATALALDWQSNTDFQYGWQKSLHVGGWQVENIPVGLVDRESGKSAGLNYDAIFGLPFLRRFFVVFNFPERTMQLLDKAPEKIEGDAIPFSYVADQMIIRASIDGRPANLLVDTGLALPSLRLDTSWALVVAPPRAEGVAPARMPEAPVREQGAEPPLPAQPPASPKASGAVGVQVASLRFANLEMKDLSVTLDTLRRRMNLNPLAVRIDGILAAPLMRNFIVSIDFEKSRIYFQKRADGQ